MCFVVVVVVVEFILLWVSRQSEKKYGEQLNNWTTNTVQAVMYQSKSWCDGIVLSESSPNLHLADLYCTCNSIALNLYLAHNIIFYGQQEYSTSKTRTLVSYKLLVNRRIFQSISSNQSKNLPISINPLSINKSSIRSYDTIPYL